MAVTYELFAKRLRGDGHAEVCACEICYSAMMLTPLLESYRSKRKSERLEQRKAAQVAVLSHVETCSVCWPALQGRDARGLCSVGSDLFRGWEGAL
jgi:hypothetical protein